MVRLTSDKVYYSQTNLWLGIYYGQITSDKVYYGQINLWQGIL